jgi:hypothetical protein
VRADSPTPPSVSLAEPAEGRCAPEPEGWVARPAEAGNPGALDPVPGTPADGARGGAWAGARGAGEVPAGARGAVGALTDGALGALTGGRGAVGALTGGGAGALTGGRGAVGALTGGGAGAFTGGGAGALTGGGGVGGGGTLGRGGTASVTGAATDPTVSPASPTRPADATGATRANATATTTKESVQRRDEDGAGTALVGRLIDAPRVRLGPGALTHTRNLDIYTSMLKKSILDRGGSLAPSGPETRKSARWAEPSCGIRRQRMKRGPSLRGTSAR